MKRLYSRAYKQQKTLRLPFQEMQAGQRETEDRAGRPLQSTYQSTDTSSVSGTHDFARLALSWKHHAQAPLELPGVSQPGDASEQEARQVAEYVMDLPSSSTPALSENPPARSLPTSKAEQPALAGDIPHHVQEVVSSPGQPLDLSTRAFMEPRFGADFSQVRIHTSEQAERSAKQVSSLAYTVGNHVVFGAGQYTPGTPGGHQLLAHELTHVLQHGQGPSTAHAGIPIQASPAPLMRMGWGEPPLSAKDTLLQNPSLDEQVERNWIRSEAEGSLYKFVKSRYAPADDSGDVRLKSILYQKKLSAGGELEADLSYYRYMSGGKVASDKDSPHFKLLAHVENSQDAKKPPVLVAQLIDWLDGHSFVRREWHLLVTEEAGNLLFHDEQTAQPTPAAEYWYDDENAPA